MQRKEHCFVCNSKQHVILLMKSVLKPNNYWLLETAWEKKAKRTSLLSFYHRLLIKNHSSIGWFSTWHPWFLWKYFSSATFICTVTFSFASLAVMLVDRGFYLYLNLRGCSWYRHICILATQTSVCLSVRLAGFKPSGGALQCLRVWRDLRSTVPWWGHPLGPVPALTAVSRHLEQPEKGRQQQMVEWAAKGGRVRVRVGGEWVSPFSCFSNNTYAGKPDASRTLSLALCCLWLLRNDCLFSLLLQNISTLYFGYSQSRLVVI